MSSISVYFKPTTIVILGLLLLYLLNPFNYGYLVGYVLAGLMLIQGSFIARNLDLDFFLLLLFSSTYAMFYAFDFESQGKQFIAIYAITPPFFYLLGKFLAKEKQEPKYLFYLLFGIGIGFSITASISVFLNFLKGGFVQIERTINLFWDNRPASATTMGSFFTLNMCIPALLILSRNLKSYFFKGFALLTFIISLICVIRLGSRTQLGVFIITTVIAILFVLPKQSFKQNILLLIALVGIAIYISRKVSFDLDADWLTTFADRMGKKDTGISSGGGRTERWAKSLEYMFKYPLGWDYNEFGHAHNFWFDVLRVSGIIPFILLIIFFIRSFSQIKRSIGLKKEALYFNGQLLVYSLGFFMLFMVEPVMDGIFMSFVVFCVIMGVINKYRSSHVQKS